jgi:hypothetical protein
VERSRHCRGENDRGWKADLDFVCQQRSWRRLLEGAYGNDAPAADRTAAWTDAEWRTALRLRRESGDWSDALGPPPGAPGCRVPAHLLVAPISGAAA